MKSDLSSDTIVALATPRGEAALAIVRLAGPQARDIAAKMAPPSQPRPSHQLCRAVLRCSDGEMLDDAMLVEMHAPRSYSGDDTVEFYLHGARAVVQGVLEACTALGARPAGPGEFTQRAFLNGRMDLAQAEAVADLISAEDEAARRAATRQLKGGLSEPVRQLIDELEGVLADWQAALDFPEYPTGEGFLAAHEVRLRAAQQKLRAWLAGSQREARRGRRVALCGAPNVGKSTLLNAWAGEERVLVDSMPGTTRDPVELQLDCDGVSWSACDTAGLRLGADALEARGMALSRQWAERADCVLWLVDPLDPVWPPADHPVDWVVGSKGDLADTAQLYEVEAGTAGRDLQFAGWISPRTGKGIEALQQHVLAGLRGASQPVEHLQVRQRHAKALQEALEGLQGALDGLDQGTTLDVLAFDLEGAARALGAILGRDVSEDVLDRVFSSFCIGK